MQVLAASVIDMLQAGICQQPETPSKPAGRTGPGQPSPEGSSPGEAEESSQAVGTDQVPANAAATDSSGLQSAQDASQPAPEPAAPGEGGSGQAAPERSCIFEVEVVLTASGTKLTPSVAQFLVRCPRLLPGAVAVGLRLT